MLPKLSKLELKIMDALWSRGAISIREIQEHLGRNRPAYTAIQPRFIAWSEESRAVHEENQ